MNKPEKFIFAPMTLLAMPGGRKFCIDAAQGEVQDMSSGERMNISELSKKDFDYIKNLVCLCPYQIETL